MDWTLTTTQSLLYSVTTHDKETDRVFTQWPELQVRCTHIKKTFRNNSAIYYARCFCKKAYAPRSSETIHTVNRHRKFTTKDTNLLSLYYKTETNISKYFYTELQDVYFEGKNRFFHFFNFRFLNRGSINIFSVSNLTWNQQFIFRSRKWESSVGRSYLVAVCK